MTLSTLIHLGRGRTGRMYAPSNYHGDAFIGLVAGISFLSISRDTKIVLGLYSR
jgi:hypothetical protein